MDDQTNQPGAGVPAQAPGAWTPPVDPAVPAEPVVNPTPEPVVPPAGGSEPVVTPTEEPVVPPVPEPGA